MARGARPPNQAAMVPFVRRPLHRRGPSGLDTAKKRDQAADPLLLLANHRAGQAGA